MGAGTDIRIESAALWLLPVRTRLPLKFGSEVTTEVTVSRVRIRVSTREGRLAEGWGETPLSVQWVWPMAEDYQGRYQALKDFSLRLCKEFTSSPQWGDPLELGIAFQEHALPGLLEEFNRSRPSRSMPWLAALVCASAYDIALHDAFGRAVGLPVWETYNGRFLNRPLQDYFDGDQRFAGRQPCDFLEPVPGSTLPAWHLVGGLDPIEEEEARGADPQDGYPVLLRDWIERDGLECLKIKLRGDDPSWDWDRLLRVGRIAEECGASWLSADFNCTVTDPEYVRAMLERLLREHPRLFGMLLYVEQPFPYDLEEWPIEVSGLSSLKPLFLDESAHDWRHIGRGRELGWNGVALKTCKTQSGALLSACWARAYGMSLMVQDLTNPMLAQIPHVLLAAQVGTLMGVETNAMQFYPEASACEALVHPGLYRRRKGRVDLSTLEGPGFGYRLEEMDRQLPPPAAIS